MRKTYEHPLLLPRHAVLPRAGHGRDGERGGAEWTTVNTFEDCYTAVKDKKEYIKLGQKIDTSSWNEGNGLAMSGSLSFEGKNFVLDLNGKTLNLQTKNNKVYSFIYLANGSLTIKDSSPEKKGTISGYFGSTAGDCDYRTIFVGENGSLTLEWRYFQRGRRTLPPRRPKQSIAAVVVLQLKMA